MDQALDKPAMSSSAPVGVGRKHYAILGLIILLGAVLRFAYLEHPAIWGDEGATWARTCGTFQEMLEGNRRDGFVPLHYELYWLMGHWWQLTPFMMRLVPAIAGVLMVPAMYFLARQLVRPGTALLAALFAATSAYFLNYSRDAKMYMQTWLMLTLHMGFLLWWLRGGGGVAWWAWVAAGVAAVGLHASAWLVVALGILFVVTSGRPRLWRWIFYPVGIAIMGVGPIVYYTGYNTWTETSGGLTSNPEAGNWGASGISWIEPQTRNKTGPQLVRESATAYLYGYSRAEEEIERGGIIPIPSWVLDAAWGTLAGIVLVLVAGAVRWPGKAAKAEALAPFHGWQLLLWLGTWVVVPTYAFFYCRSMRGPISPWEAAKGIAAFYSWHWLWIAPAGLVLAWLAGRVRVVMLVLAWMLGLAFVVLVIVCILQQRAEWYVALLKWTAMPCLLGAFIVLMASVSCAACGMDNRLRWRRMVGGLVATLIILVICQVAWMVMEHLRYVAEQAGRAPHSIWMPRYLAVVMPAMLVIMAIAIRRLPGRVIPAVMATAFVSVNLAQYGARIVMDPEPRVDLLAADLLGAERDPGYLVYVRDKGQFGAPGTGSVNDTTTRYYLAQGLGRRHFDPETMRLGSTGSMLTRSLNQIFSLRWLISGVKREPSAHHLILWEKLSVSPTATSAEIAKALGSDWMLVSEWSQKTRRHWNWQDIDALRRLEFVRVKFSPPPPPVPRPDSVLFP